MNRLILVGNGFDLAHGLKTDYNSFIVWYLKKCFTEADNNGEYIDELINVSRNKHVDIPRFEIKNISDFIDNFYKDGFAEIFPNMISYKKSGTTRYTNPFNIKIQNSFFEHLVLKCKDLNWVDIENEFYDQLKYILKEKDHVQKITSLTILNHSLKSIISELEIYLKTIRPSNFLNGYKEIFESNIELDDIINSSLSLSTPPKESLILNFNYTPTVEYYFNRKGDIWVYNTININYIHGKVKDEKNPIIFGFGDELDDDYLKIESEKINKFFEYIKSFWYFKTSNYHDLIRFIEADDFQIYVLGHSCGLSDRTMLNMIFEHENCKSIKIYYHEINKESNNFKNLTQEISRHFKNKAEMRKKIVPFDKSQPMPQAYGYAVDITYKSTD